MEQVASIAVVKYRSNHEIQSSVLNCTWWAQTMAAMETIGQASLPFFFLRNINKKNLSWEVIYIHLVLSGSVEKVRGGLKLYNNQLPQKILAWIKKADFN